MSEIISPDIINVIVGQGVAIGVLYWFMKKTNSQLETLIAKVNELVLKVEKVCLDK